MSIDKWPHQDRPREKLLSKGAAFLTETELLAILLRTGVQGKSAVDLARDLIGAFKGLKNLLEADYASISKHKGIGTAKYVQLQVILEISRRYFLESLQKTDVIDNIDLLKKYVIAKLCRHKKEVFACICLNSQHEIIHYAELFFGSITSATIYPREVVKYALDNKAAAIILAHNHPSGNLDVSDQDKVLTQKLITALQVLDIPILDHIIVADNASLSFFETGIL